MSVDDKDCVLLIVDDDVDCFDEEDEEEDADDAVNVVGGCLGV